MYILKFNNVHRCGGILPCFILSSMACAAT